MERKKEIIKKESKIKRNEEIRTKFSNAGFIHTTKSEIFSESSLIETEVLTNRTVVETENCHTERINIESIDSKCCKESPKMRISHKNDSIKPAILNDFNRMKDLNRVHGGNLMGNKPSIAIDHTKDVNLHNLNEVLSSSVSFKSNPSEGDDAVENLTKAKHVDCNPSNELHLNTKEVLKNSISEKSPIKNQENEGSHGIKLAPDREINVHYTGNFPTHIKYKNSLNFGKGSNINTEFCNPPLRSANMGTENSESAVLTQNRIKIMNKRKELKKNKFFNNSDIYERGDNNLISSADKRKNEGSREQGNKFGGFKGKDHINKSVTYLVDYFENMKNPSPIKIDLKSNAFNSDKRKLSETTKRQKRKSTDDHSLPNKKAPLHDFSNSSIQIVNFNAEDCTKKIRFVSKNIGLLKKSKEDVQPHFSPKADPNFNFNDDTAEFCVVKCRQTQIGSNRWRKTPRQPREDSFTFAQRATNLSNRILSTPKSPPTGSPDLQKHARENFSPPNSLPDKSAKTKEKISIDDSPSVDSGFASIGGIEPESLNGKAGYQHKKFNKASTDEQKLQKSSLDVEKKICMNSPFHSRRHLKAGISKIEESSYKEDKGKSLEKEESSFVKCFSSLILFMAIFAFGSYYQFFK